MGWLGGVALLAGGVAVAQAPVGWLRYAIPPDPPRYHDLPHAVVLLGDAATGQIAPEEQTAADELDRGLGHMVAGTDTLLRRFDPRYDAIVLGTTDAIRHARLGRGGSRNLPGWIDRPLGEDGYRIVHLRRGARQWWVLQGGSPRGEMYAAYRFAALVAEDQQLPEEWSESPAVGLRAVAVRGDVNAVLRAAMAVLPPPGDGVAPYTPMTGAGVLGRLLSSVAVNALMVPRETRGWKELAEALRPFGVRVWLSTDDAASLPGLATVAAASGNAGGVVLRSGKDVDVAAVNAAARVLKPHGAAVLLEGALGAPLRAPGAPPSATGPEQRAMMLHGVEGLRGMDANVVLGGEAVSPLLPHAGLGSGNFGLMAGTAQAAEFALMPGREREVVFPLPGWLHALETPENGGHGDTTLLGTLQAAPRGGMVGVVCAEELAAMMRQPLLQANLFAFGRMAWNPAPGAGAIAEAWARQTWGDDARVFGVAMGVLLPSEEAYRNNSSPFGMVSLAGSGGGPDPARAVVAEEAVSIATRDGVGVDRTAHGTNEVNRFPAGFAGVLSDVGKVPAEWLLAVHRVPLTYGMRNGKSVVQNFYDAHFAGAAAAANAVDAWEGTRPLVDAERYAEVLAMLESSARRAEIWRDATTEWMERMTGVADAQGFAGKHAGRVEAESMGLKGYVARSVGYEDASDAALIACAVKDCRATTEFRGEDNVYRVEVGYFDSADGAMTLRVNGVVKAQWPVLAPDVAGLGAPNAERFVVNGVRLKAGDHLEVAGGDGSAVDFVEITRDPRWN